MENNTENNAVIGQEAWEEEANVESWADHMLTLNQTYISKSVLQYASTPVPQYICSVCA